MKVVLLSMPDVVPIIIHEMAIHMPNHGIACVGGNIDERHEVYLIDLVRKRNHIAAYLEKKLKRIDPALIGLSAMTWQYPTCMALIGLIKSILPRAKIAVGGYHATFASEKILTEYNFVDYIIKGEAEHAMVQLLERLENGNNLEDVTGISYRHAGKTINNPLRLVSELDALPFPDRELLSSIDYGYSFQGIPLTFGKFTTLSTSRGCPFRCTYCSCAAFSLRKWRPRSAENVIEELETVQEQGYKNCVIVDDNFTHNPKRTEDICNLIL